MSKFLLNADDYNILPWNEKYPEFNADITKLKIHNSWKDFDFKKEYTQRLNNYLSHCLKVTSGKIKIYPYPDLLFNALNMTPLNKIKVVFLGQDPYHNNEIHHEEIIPQAMGLAFSVPVGIEIPSSLKNIYQNLINYGHIDSMPPHGNLSFWAHQGCLLLNTSLTVQHGYPNRHAEFWKPITDNLIKYISDHCENIVFVLWGGPALEKLNLIDTQKHKVIISSHPSGLSYNKPLRNYKPFNEVDHFSKINKYLIKHNKNKILWKIV
jgi:uracil-DNA glycosylase